MVFSPISLGLILLSFYIFLLTVVYLIHNLKYHIYFQHLCNIFINIICFYICNEIVCILITQFLLFYNIFVLHNHTKTRASLFCLILIVFLKTALFINALFKIIFCFFYISILISIYGFSQTFWLNLITLWTFFKSNPWFNACFKFIFV